MDERIKDGMEKMESMLNEWEDAAQDMGEDAKNKMDEGMMHIRKGLDMMKD